MVESTGKATHNLTVDIGKGARPASVVGQSGDLSKEAHYMN